ncbi:MAG TPA: (Fe-S)-binding protein [Polyangiaceae bacterium]
MKASGTHDARREGASGASRSVRLMATCLADAFFDDVARATVEVLEHLGCRVEVPADQTCCGQPAFNAGDWEAARRVARHTLKVFAGDEPVVVPSGSCARMASHGALMLFERETDRETAETLAERSFELADFIVRELGVTRFGGRFDGRVAFHGSCHCRGTSYAESALALLRSIAGLELVPVGEGEQCCGFGGTFSATFPGVSTRMGDLKLEHLLAGAPDVVVSADMGCLMHLGGRAQKEGRPLRALHVAQVLRDALRPAQSAS